jgi:predicted RNA-binding Zn-ribbon protein involved in translation (DUF1610 family)
MKTAADVVTTISAIYYQVNLFEDKQLTGYMNHFAWPEWGGHKQMIQGAKAEMLEWIRRYLEPQERGEAFDHFEFSYHPYYPGIGVEVHRDTGTPNTSVHILPGRTRFCVFSACPLEAVASHVILDSRVPRPLPVSRPRVSILGRTGSTLRETCRGCGETYTEDNMFDCPHCGGEYCWRCRDGHTNECAPG